MVSQKVARAELQVLEVERRLACLRRRVRLGETVEQDLEQVAIVRRELVERPLLDRLPGFLVRGCALASRAVRREVEQPLGQRSPTHQLEQAARIRPRELGGLGVIGQALSGDAELGYALRERRSLTELEHQWAAGGAQRLVHADQHPAQAVRAVRPEQAQPLGVGRPRRSGRAPRRRPRRE